MNIFFEKSNISVCSCFAWYSHFFGLVTVGKLFDAAQRRQVAHHGLHSGFVLQGGAETHKCLVIVTQHCCHYINGNMSLNKRQSALFQYAEQRSHKSSWKEEMRAFSAQLFPGSFKVTTVTQKHPMKCNETLRFWLNKLIWSKCARQSSAPPSSCTICWETGGRRGKERRKINQKWTQLHSHSEVEEHVVISTVSILPWRLAAGQEPIGPEDPLINDAQPKHVNFLCCFLCCFLCLLSTHQCGCLQKDKPALSLYGA